MLGESGSYRYAVSPPLPHQWPPSADWGTVVQNEAKEWRAGVESSSEISKVPPSIVARLEALQCNGDVTIAALRGASVDWRLCAEILTLHAVADEACDAIGISPISKKYGPAPRFDLAARRRLVDGSLSSADIDVVRVLPKLRTPQVGIALRSLSRNLSFHRSEVRATWQIGPIELGDPTSLNLLLVPWPMKVGGADLREVEGPLKNMDRTRFGFFTFEPREPFPRSLLENLIRAAQRESGRTPDGVVFPESSVTEKDLAAIQSVLERLGIGILIAGVRQAPKAPEQVGRNEAQLRLRAYDKWQVYSQPKHHRWAIDENQNRQYGLSASLSAGRTWWEAIEIHRRSVHFVKLNDWFTVCPLVCEDLARQDPVAGVLRAVGPTLVVGLLMDGPQLKERWAARYATVLADDPGTSVLTFTSLGMALRSKAEGKPSSRVVACWKDGKYGIREIELPTGSDGILLSVYAEWIPQFTADGRATDTGAPRLALAGVQPLSGVKVTASQEVPAPVGKTRSRRKRRKR